MGASFFRIFQPEMSDIWAQSEGHKILATLGIKSVEDAWNPDLPGEIVNDRGDRQVLRVVPSPEEPPVYLKRWRFSTSNPRRILPGNGDLRWRARREKENLELLGVGGIVAPSPLAMGETRGPFGPVATFLFMSEMTGYRPACDLLPMPLGDAFQLIHGITETLGKLHTLDRYARSPGLKHFYVTEDRRSFGLIDVPRLDKPAHGWMAGLKKAFGMDIPSRERDLSKIWVEWNSYFPKAEEWQEAFWRGYATHFPSLANNPNWRTEVIRLADWRAKRRGRKD
ncbi:MAG: hypothetical protein KC931_18830 [Candidatus Omnitrophica bacterium]|nr:hypothetical protein [Candidatus Omnitrophota bacterium]